MIKIMMMLTLLIAFNTNASLISVDVSDTNISVGDTLSVTINAVDFEATDGFFFNFNYLASIFDFDKNSILSDIAVVETGSGNDGISADESLAGEINFDSLTGSDVVGNFLIASFDLTAIAQGLNIFDLNNFFSYAATSDYNVTYVSGNEVTVNTAAAIPEPASILLFLAGLMLVAGRRKLF